MKRLISKKSLFILLLIALAGVSRAEVINGNCGAESGAANVKWSLNTEKGVLTLTGTGAMKDDFYQQKAPWYDDISKIKTVEVGEGITSIGSWAFKNCYEMTSISLPSTLKKIGTEAFRYCGSLMLSELPASVNEVGQYAFSYCGITAFTIPSALKKLPEGMFYNCGSLAKVTFHSKVTEIGYWAFFGCSSLEEVELPNKLETIGYNAFYESGLTSITIPNSVTNLDAGSLRDCSKLTKVVLGTGIEKIQYETFMDDRALVEVVIPNSVKRIGDRAFAHCTVLPSLHLPASLQFIGEESFAGCTGLTELTCEALEPPYGQYHVFEGIDNTIPVYVPRASITKYSTDNYWKYFSNYQSIEGEPTAVEATKRNEASVTKQLREGQIIIRRGGRTYTVHGQEVR